MKTVILAAGFGSRLWPLSTSERPKQFQRFINDQSLLQYTYELLRNFTPARDLYVLTLAGLEDLVAEQIPGIDSSNVIIVPERRNTLPHTAYALNKLKLASDEQVLFTPVDHYMRDTKTFLSDLKTIPARIADKHATYLLCSAPQTIDRSLGYVQTDTDGRVIQFVEKPDGEALAVLSKQDGVYLNTLRFITSLAAFSRLLDQAGSQTAAMAKAVLGASGSQLDKRFLTMPVVDISHGLFEKVRGLRALIVGGDFIDVGKFSTLYEVNKKDTQGNVVTGQVIFDGSCRNNFVINQLDQPLVVVDTQDSVIVQTAFGTIVSPMAAADRIGEIYKSVIHRT